MDVRMEGGEALESARVGIVLATVATKEFEGIEKRRSGV